MARRRRRNQGSEVPYGEWLPTHAVRFNADGTVSMMTEGESVNPGRSAGAGYGTWTEARYGSGTVEHDRAKHAREATRKKGAKVTALEKGYSGWGFKYAYPLDPPQYSLFNRGRRNPSYRTTGSTFRGPYDHGMAEGLKTRSYPKPETIRRLSEEWGRYSGYVDTDSAAADYRAGFEKGASIARERRGS